MNEDDVEIGKLWDDDIDNYYDLINSATGEIRFRTEHAYYATLKSALMGVGVDIATITTEDELDAIELIYLEHITAFIAARLINRQPATLSQALLKATLLGDREEAERIRERLTQRQRLGLRVVE